MPLTKWICPDKGEIPLQDCIKDGGCRMCTRCCARPVLKLMAASQREWKGIPSTTQLIKGTMQAFLEIKHDYSLPPDKLAFSITGSGTHYALEKQGDETSRAEMDLSDDDGSIRPDLVEMEKGINTLIDYKICGSFTIMKALGIYFEEVPMIDPVTNKQMIYKSGAKKGKPRTKKEKRIDPKLADLRDWALQLNNYRIGLEKKLKIKIHNIRVQAVVRDGGTAMAMSRGVDRNIYFIDIPKVPDEQIKEYFRKKKADLLKALKDEHWSTPCNDIERWEGLKCQMYCPVNTFCPYWIETYKPNIVTEDGQEVQPSTDIGADGCPE